MPSRAKAILIQREQDRLMQSIERPFIRRINAEKNRFVNAAVEQYRTTRMVTESQLLADHQQNMEAIAKRYLGQSIRAFGRHTFKQSKSGLYLLEQKDDDEDSLFDWMERQWLQKEGLKEAKLAAQTTFDDIRRALLTAQEKQEDARNTIKRIQAVKVINRFRAETIARTETHNAAMFASGEVADAIQNETDTQLLKFWIAAQDERTRESHMDMDSEEGIGLDALFDVGGEPMDRPGDPGASPENVINCRCVMVFEESQ